MASAVVTRPDLFPPGTVLKAYPASNWMTSDPPSGAPVGEAEKEATVDESGVATFSGLAADKDFQVTASVGGVYRYVKVNTGSGGTVTGARDEPEGALKSLLQVLERRGIITDGTTES